MNHIEVSTVVYAPREEVFDFLLDFPGYARYSSHLSAVGQDGDGGPGTAYDLTFAWWRLSHTVRSVVMDVTPPDRIDWELRDTVDASGHWQVSPADSGEAKTESVSRVSLVIHYAPGSADTDGIDLPAFVSLDWLVETVRPKVLAEAETIVERVVADLEGEPRPVDLEVRTA